MTLTVFAAASMKNALDDVNAAFTKATGIKVVASYAACSALAKQIEQGAPADVFVSADLEWMDYVEQKKLIKDGTRVNLLGNRLVLIAPKDSKLDDVDDRPGLRPRQARRRRPHRDRRRAARCRPDNMPRRRWRSSAAGPRRSRSWRTAENVRAALALVARGEAPLGIVYETDAKIEPNVKIVGAFPEDSHPPITYPVAPTATQARGRAVSRIPALGGDAKAIFETHGFTFLIKPTS